MCLSKWTVTHARWRLHAGRHQARRAGPPESELVSFLFKIRFQINDSVCGPSDSTVDSLGCSVLSSQNARNKLPVSLDGLMLNELEYGKNVI